MQFGFNNSRYDERIYFLFKGQGFMTISIVVDEPVLDSHKHETKTKCTNPSLVATWTWQIALAQTSHFQYHCLPEKFKLLPHLKNAYCATSQVRYMLALCTRNRNLLMSAPSFISLRRIGEDVRPLVGPLQEGKSPSAAPLLSGERGIKRLSPLILEEPSTSHFSTLLNM